MPVITERGFLWALFFESLSNGNVKQQLFDRIVDSIQELGFRLITQ